ncbi:MAG: rod shape-determining protein [Clostridia bacterium]|nr:rod shape-determining protein [Clostridia bacterium]
MNILNFANRDLGIDLGTANILVTLRDKGIIYREPSVVAYNKETKEIIAVGEEAKEMLGKTPPNIIAIRPLKDGVIADFTATKLMLREVMEKVCKKNRIYKPQVIVGVPSGITEVEERAVEEAIISSGAREVFLVDEPMAAAIGADVRVAEPSGSIIADIGGGTTEVAVISLGGIVVSNSIKIAGDELTEDIINYAKKKLDIIIGENTAERIKKEIGCASPLLTEEYREIRGRDVYTGLPVVKDISSIEVENALKSSINKIVESVKVALEQTPPELISDIAIKGLVVAGGGALIKNIDVVLQEKLEIPVTIAEEPLDCVVNGTKKMLEDMDTLRKVAKKF